MAREVTIQGGGEEPKRPQTEPDRVIDSVEEKLRPQRLGEIVGQREVAERLSIALEAARKRNEPLPHILFDGPPGLGKTTFATVLHNELGAELYMTSGAASTRRRMCCRISRTRWRAPFSSSTRSTVCPGWWRSSFTR